MRSVLVYLALATTAWSARLYSSYDFDPLEHLSGTTPYYEPSDPPRDPAPPPGCSVTRAAYLVSHAAINANDFDYETYLEPFLQKLDNQSVDWSSIPALSFLADWSEPNFSELEQLTRTGKLEAAKLGVTISHKYRHLRLPQRVWSATAERVVKSASSLIRGLEAEDDTINLVEIYEGEEAGGDSLTPDKACPAFSSSAGSEQEMVCT
jgi:acid phosphatase